MSLPSPGSDRAAIVTGASSGIGAAIARELVRHGHQVVLVARSADKLSMLADEIGAGAHVVPADLSDPAARAGLLDAVTSIGVVPDVLINNAGFSTLGPVHRGDPDADVNMLEVDVVAVADLCARFLPGMVSRGRGAVLNVSSTAAFQPLPGQAAYAAGKAFVLLYTQALAGELRGTGVSVTALCPGPTATRFFNRAGFDRPDRAFPRILWKDVDYVARAAIDGLDRGRLVVIPGAANRVSAVLAHLTPRSVLLPILARGHPALRR